MIWALYAELGQNMWFTESQKLEFEDSAWKKLVDSVVENGFNTIILDLGEGVRYASHPELAKEGAWTRERVREEVRELRERGITLIPKFNFSACHHMWLGDYRKMMGLPKYYEVCRDLITEIYNLFDKPEYIHIGMDEEGDERFFRQMDLVAYRQGELLWHDLQFLLDCVRDTGAKPWIWADIAFTEADEFQKRIKPGSVMLSPWNYRGLKPEHYTPIAGSEYEEYYNGTGYTYVEEDPLCVRYMERSLPTANAGYDIVPCASVIWNEYNADDVVEYFTENMTDHTAGFMIAPWRTTSSAHIDEIIKNITALKSARDKFCK